MKKICFLLAAFVMISFTGKETSIQELDNTGNAELYKINNDKGFLLDYFKKTNQKLKKSVRGLTEAQSEYKPSPEAWSANQCLEHIILTEARIFETTKELLSKPANPDRKEEVKMTDQELIDGMTDRSSKVMTSKELQPEGKYDSPETALKDLKDQRAQIINFIKKTSEEDLRNHITDSPFGALDAYQWLLFIAAHTARHTAQIEEVKAHAGFPSK